MSNNMSRFRKLRYQKWYKYFNKMDNDEKTCHPLLFSFLNIDFEN